MSCRLPLQQRQGRIYRAGNVGHAEQEDEEEEEKEEDDNDDDGDEKNEEEGIQEAPERWPARKPEKEGKLGIYAAKDNRYHFRSSAAKK